MKDTTIPCPDGTPCDEAQQCATDSCDEWVCGDHTADPFPCANVGLHHDEQCATNCDACMAVAKPTHPRDGVR